MPRAPGPRFAGRAVPQPVAAPRTARFKCLYFVYACVCMCVCVFLSSPASNVGLRGLNLMRSGAKNSLVHAAVRVRSARRGRSALRAHGTAPAGCGDGCAEPRARLRIGMRGPNRQELPFFICRNLSNLQMWQTASLSLFFIS